MAIKKYIGPNRISEIFSYIKAELDKKVTAVSGKGLSSNDYTTTEKNKLAGISSGAEVNVQADWDVDNASSDAYILHKPTSMPASDVPSWAKQPNKPSYTFSEITNRPTTLAGYGITDAKIANGTITLGSNSITPLTQHQDISGKADKATTLAGYGITDAKIVNGTITLGSNTITPLTQHQSVTNKGATLAWSSAVTVATIGSTDIKVSLPANPNTDTTYTISTGDSNGQIKVTPSSGNAYNVSVKGLGSNAYSSTAYLPLAGGAVTGKITRDAGGSWINARDNALIMTTRTSGSGSDWHPAVAIKTSSGCWSFGSVGGESLSLSYDTDENYSARNNTSNVINFPTAGKTGTIALTSDIPTKVSQLTNDSGYSTKSETTIYKGNLTSLGSGTPAAATQTYWENNTNIPVNTVSTAYNTSGAEYTLVLSKGGNNKVGSVLKYGYTNRYLYILRMISGTWQSTDWEKIYAGYADSAGSVAWPNVSSKPTTISGYGITDAKIANGTITLGSNTITPLTSITSSQVTTALGYTPYNSSNPSGYITSSGSCAYATSAGSATKATQDDNGDTIKSTYMKKGVDYVTAGTASDTYAAAYATAEGYGNTSSGRYSHAEGYGNTVTTDAQEAHVEGWNSTVSANGAHAEGLHTTASGLAAHAEGSYFETYISGVAYQYYNLASGEGSHVEGLGTVASGIGAHAEGSAYRVSNSIIQPTSASGDGSHAEGLATTAAGEYSHSEGFLTHADGNYSHAEGDHTYASSDYQHVEGKYNVLDTNGTYAHIIGGGTDSTRKNIFTVDWNGDVCAGRSAGLANSTKLPTGADVIGYLVNKHYARVGSSTVSKTTDQYGQFSLSVSNGYIVACGVDYRYWVMRHGETSFRLMNQGTYSVKASTTVTVWYIYVIYSS